MALYANGLIPTAALDAVPAVGGQTAWLLPGPAASLLRVQAECRRRHKWTPLVTSAGDGFRSLNRQEAVFRQRYRPTYSTVMQGGRLIVDRRVWNGTAWYRFTGSAAAVPGTSNHGLGITVDLSGLGGFGATRFNQVSELMVAEGWSNAEGRSVAEPWHWNYTRSAYEVTNTNLLPGVDITIPNIGDLPDLLTPEDDLNDEQNAVLNAIHENAAEARRVAGEARDEVRGVAQHVKRLQEGVDAIFINAVAANENAGEARRLAGTPQQIAAAIPADIARSVVDELVRRLGE